MGVAVENEHQKPVNEGAAKKAGLPFGAPRENLGNRFVYAVISSRARGLSVGVNLTPDRRCNFDCVYCEVDRKAPVRDRHLDVAAMAEELERTLTHIHQGQWLGPGGWRQMPTELLQLRHVALSGDGEPTLSPKFAEVVEAVIHVRARGQFPFFKLVLITNASGLDLPAVQAGLKLFIQDDEIWAKLDGGSPAYLKRVNRPSVDLDKVFGNILLVGRQRPIVIQSLFPLLDGQEPADEEIDAYAARLQELKAGGAQISLVQVYSATRPTHNGACGHLPLKSLSKIAHKVRTATGLAVEVF
jgi:wyosine [tRNA(Phe)-imidazoG37] synthetase (radical SAM superfamily)